MSDELMQMSYLWRGFPMVAVKAKDGKGKVIHLGKRRLPGTICGIAPSRIVDAHVATGWPDCQKCVELAGPVE